MHFGQYVFTQIASFLPKRYFGTVAHQQPGTGEVGNAGNW